MAILLQHDCEPIAHVTQVHVYTNSDTHGTTKVKWGQFLGRIVKGGGDGCIPSLTVSFHTTYRIEQTADVHVQVDMYSVHVQLVHVQVHTLLY